ncbi:MAG: EthD domain-containing protein [Thermomicrobiales bacterium]
MIKLVSLMNRKPGLSREEFIAYYEAHHRLIGEKVLAGYACRYIRRYTTAVGEGMESDPDVVMEIWFPDQLAYDSFFAAIAAPGQMAEIVADEERLFDRGKMRFFLVEECESDLPAPTITRGESPHST